MRKYLTIGLALACGGHLDISQAQTSTEPLEEVIVTGEFAGPGMWPNPEVSCETAIMDALAMTTPVPADVRRQMDELWFAAAVSAVTKNESTLAFVKMGDLLGDHGYLESLRKRGYEILAPS